LVSSISVGLLDDKAIHIHI